MTKSGPTAVQKTCHCLLSLNLSNMELNFSSVQLEQTAAVLDNTRFLPSSSFPVIVFGFSSVCLRYSPPGRGQIHCFGRCIFVETLGCWDVDGAVLVGQKCVQHLRCFQVGCQAHRYPIPIASLWLTGH